MKPYLEQTSQNVPESCGKPQEDWNWFGEESFTYIKVLGSYAEPHVVPLYIPDKLLCREVVYQTIGHGITNALKDSNKRVWP